VGEHADCLDALAPEERHDVVRHVVVHRTGHAVEKDPLQALAEGIRSRQHLVDVAGFVKLRDQQDGRIEQRRNVLICEVDGAAGPQLAALQ